MKCVSCNEEIIDNSPYCPYCGEPQPVVANINQKKSVESESLESKIYVQETVATTSNTESVKENIKEDPNITEKQEYTTEEETVQLDEIKESIEEETSVEESIDKSEKEILESPDEADDTAVLSENESTEIHYNEMVSNEDTDTASSVMQEEQDKEAADTSDESEEITDKKHKKKKKEKKPKRLSIKNDKKSELAEALSGANDDGYYSETTPLKNEMFPISKGEIIAKFILIGLLLISIALFMVYVIQ